MKRWVLGITGGIASGKTTVLSLLARHGIPTISADTIVHRFLQKGQRPYRSILRHFGSQFLLASGEINRSSLGEIIFTDPAKRRCLEHILHPYVIRELRRFISKQRRLCAIDIPLLHEAKLEHLVDEVVLVDTTQALQIRRLRTRSGLTRRQSLDRIRAQMPLSLKRKKAHTILRNKGSLSSLEKQVSHLLQNLKKRKIA